MKNKTVDCKTILLILAVGLFVIGVTHIGHTVPYFIDEGDTATRSVDENAAVGTNVGAAFTIDKDGFKTVRYEFPDYNNKFEYIVGRDKSFVQIQTKVRLNYEVQSSYTVRLILKYFDNNPYGDGSPMGIADTVTVTINVNDVAERPTLPFPSAGDALPALTSEERQHIISLLTLDTIIFNELFNASNNAHDWLELRNVTNADVDLSGWHLIVATGGTTIVHEFSTGTVLPAGELLLLLNTDPDDPDMPLATSTEPSYHYLNDAAFALPQEDFMLLLRSPSAWEDSAGSYLFGQEKLPTIVDFALDTAWFRAKATVFGHRNNAWIISGYHDGLGYDNDTPKNISLGTPGYPHETIVGDANGDGIVNILDLVLVASQIGQSSGTDADMNGDGSVNIQDLVVIANGLGNIAAAPSAEALTVAKVEQWLKLAKQNVSTRPIQTSLSQQKFSYERGIQVLEDILRILRPNTTALLANYPNPFNPETWIPYQLATASDVRITIYDGFGTLVRQFALGHQPAGLYQARDRAAYWDGTNALGESVASGIYFYTLTTDDFSATRKMLILK
ncbi:hypothetical protein C6500_02635 [Candidatus Poribacteria bacterium]|nr:MAG: hypothetical protein C6500_02635 [Candidatus Poribacteria bacterium]